jgi:hypothetical protein
LKLGLVRWTREVIRGVAVWLRRPAHLFIVVVVDVDVNPARDSFLPFALTVGDVGRTRAVELRAS